MADEHRSAEHDDRPFAVLDVGSNSARMIVFRLRDGEHLDVIEDARAALRLARELHAGAELGPSAIERTLEALRDFRAVAEGAGADRILAVATSAVRDAIDGRFCWSARRELGVPLQIIDGDTEARLGFVGAVHDLPGDERRDARRRRGQRGDLAVPRSPSDADMVLRARIAPGERPVLGRRSPDRLATQAAAEVDRRDIARPPTSRP